MSGKTFSGPLSLTIMFLCVLALSKCSAKAKSGSEVLREDPEKVLPLLIATADESKSFLSVSQEAEGSYFFDRWIMEDAAESQL